jgi:hypothetical protein
MEARVIDAIATEQGRERPRIKVPRMRALATGGLANVSHD